MVFGIVCEIGVFVVVICMLGMVVVNLLFVVMEVFYFGVLLFLFIVDCFLELCGVGVNQVIIQDGFFYFWVCDQFDVFVLGDGDWFGFVECVVVVVMGVCVGEYVWFGVVGFVYLNLLLWELFFGELLFVVVMLGELFCCIVGELWVFVCGLCMVVVVGVDVGLDVEEFVYVGGWFLIVEIVSGVWFGCQFVYGYCCLFCCDDFGGCIECVVVFGYFMFSCEVVVLLLWMDVEVVVCYCGGEQFDFNYCMCGVDVVFVVFGVVDCDWFGVWFQVLVVEVVDLSENVLDLEGFVFIDFVVRWEVVWVEFDVVCCLFDREFFVDVVWCVIWLYDWLVFGLFWLVWVVDQVFGGKKVFVYVNCGFVGIDGMIVIVIGIVFVSQVVGVFGVICVLFGDLVFLYDVGVLLLLLDEIELCLQVIVGNDGGGMIFDVFEVVVFV